MTSTRILIVEDEILIASEIKDHLSELGYTVVGVAADAETALQRVAETIPHLVLMDIAIQGEQDGIAVAAQIHDRFQIPVIYLTAYADDKTLERAKLTRPFGYILKPFNQRDLRATIEIALSRHEAELAEKTAADSPSWSFEHLSMLSHELRNPIAAIQISTRMLGEFDGAIDEAKKQQLLQRIQVAAESMNELIEDVLTLGQAEHQLASFCPDSTDLIEFCQTLIEAFQWSPSHPCALQLLYQPDLIQACVDKKLLWHLLSNLVSNAIKYSPEGNTVMLRLSCTQKEICIEIQDQGIGIAPDDLGSLFQPFYRGRNVGKLPGTGLGLAIAKRAAQLHGGDIAVKSQVGYGTTFTVRMPLVQC